MALQILLYNCEVLCVTVAMVTAVAWKPTKT